MRMEQGRQEHTDHMSSVFLLSLRIRLYAKSEEEGRWDDLCKKNI